MEGAIGDHCDEFASLVLGAGEDNDGLFWGGDGVTEGFAGDDGAFAPLAVAAKDEVFGGGIEDFDLFGERLEIEHLSDPFRGFEGIRD